MTNSEKHDKIIKVIASCRNDSDVRTTFDWLTNIYMKESTREQFYPALRVMVIVNGIKERRSA